MEEFVQFKASDGHTIHGTLNFAKGEKGDKACLIVHGLTGHRNEPLHVNATQPLNAAGIATLRISLYTDEEGGRAFDESSLRTHVEDVASSVEFLKGRGYTTIYGVGHSYGAPSLFLGDTSPFAALALWDPSSQKRWEQEGIPAKRFERYGCFVIDWGKKIIVGDEMLDSMKEGADYFAAVSKIVAPVLVVSAGKGVLMPYSEELLTQITSPTKHVVIEEAAHCFNEEGCFKKLHAATLDWFLSGS